MRKQARCLLDVDGNTEISHPSLVEMHQRSLEATAVLMCFSMCSPSNNGITHSLNMKDGTLFKEPPSADALARLLVSHADYFYKTQGSCSSHLALVVLPRQSHSLVEVAA